MKKIKSFLFLFIFVFGSILNVCADELTPVRVKMYEEHANEVGISNIDTYKRVFAVNSEIEHSVAEKTGFPPDYFGLIFETHRINQYVINKGEPFKVVDYQPEEKYFFSIPVIYDYIVMISRKEERLDLSNNITDKICATFPSDIVTGDWVKELGITKFDRNNAIASSACQKIIDKEADIMFLPERLAKVVFDIMDFSDKLYMTRPLLEISYRFVFDKDKQLECEITNSEIIEMIENGEFQEVCKKYGLSQSLNDPKRVQQKLLRYVIMFLVIALFINLCVLIRVYWGGDDGKKEETKILTKE